MQCYLGVKFRLQGQIYFFYAQEDAAAAQVKDWVLVTTEEGPGLAHVAVVQDDPPPGISPEEIKTVDRLATAEDFQSQVHNEELRKEALTYCREKIRELGLDMKLVDVEVRFDQSKIVFYFTAPARIDFRDLVKILVSKHRTRIELRQIGVRHEAQILGGIGNCGRICCCHLFMRKFDPVTIKMAKEQQLFLNPSKISGACGRLLCCLNFEREQYKDFQRRCPKIGKWYETPKGDVKVLRANMFRDSLIVDAGEGEREITLAEWNDLLQGDDQGQADQVFESTSGHQRGGRKKSPEPRPGPAEAKGEVQETEPPPADSGTKADTGSSPEKEQGPKKRSPGPAGPSRKGKGKTGGPRSMKGRGKKKKQEK
ncbi:MAG: regulatory iron-sulfur-containing complex subunit RicT [Desulfovermiculus sp.]